MALEMNKPASGRGLGILTSEGALYIGSTLNTTIHTAHAFKIYVAIEGEFALLLDDSRNWESLTSVIIAPDRPHKVVGGDAIVAVYYLIPELSRDSECHGTTAIKTFSY